jgi:hypothetical protein
MRLGHIIDRTNGHKTRDTRTMGSTRGQKDTELIIERIGPPLLAGDRETLRALLGDNGRPGRSAWDL